MSASRLTVILILLLGTNLILLQKGAFAANGQNVCKVDSFPQDIQHRLKEEYSSWKVQEPANLSKRARERWESEKPLGCPGIAIGHFESSKTLSYAVLVVPTGHTDGGYRLVVFSQKEGQPSYNIRVVDQLDQSGSANYFIHLTPISKFFDEPSRKKFQAHTEDGILLVDSAENEYEVDVYFWSDGSYRHEPIDH